MKQILILCAFLAGFLSSAAQTVISHFTVGPYDVDYLGEGEVKYRLGDNIDLYDYFELQRDTAIIAAIEEIPVDHAIQISGFVGANPFRSKEFGLTGVWKQNISTNLYFNGGLSLALAYANFGRLHKRNVFEAGIPLQIELGKLTHQKASLYGSIGVAPTVYSAIAVKDWTGKQFEDEDKELKKSGFLIVPSLEFGGNIPVGDVIMRIGIYGSYKINCTTDAYDLYQQFEGRAFFGAKIGIVL